MMNALEVADGKWPYIFLLYVFFAVNTQALHVNELQMVAHFNSTYMDKTKSSYMNANCIRQAFLSLLYFLHYKYRHLKVGQIMKSKT